MPHGGRRVVLTGASGFIGRACLELLVEGGWEVHAVTSRPPPQDSAGAFWRRVDLTDPAATRALVDDVRPTHLLHLAWGFDRHGSSYLSPENYRWVGAGLDLLRAFTESGGRRVIYAGTCAEYDWDCGFCSEASTPLRPASTYGVCKRALFEVFDDYLTRHGPSGGGAWARLFFLFGPHEPAERLIPAVINAILRGEPTRCSHGRQIRDYLFSRDAAAALVALLDSDATGPFNVGSGEPTRLRDLIRRTAGRLGREDLVELGAIPVPEDDPPLVVADVRRLHSALGWRPTWELDAALDHTIEWWRSQRNPIT